VLVWSMARRKDQKLLQNGRVLQSMHVEESPMKFHFPWMDLDLQWWWLNLDRIV